MEKYTVLVVDDEKEIRDAIEIYLRNENISVLKAEDGIEAIELLTENEVHVILMDIMMPRQDGITTTFKIREQKNIPIIMLSAKSEDSDKILGLQIGADDYITKPFNAMELVARVKSQLRRYMSLGTYNENGIAVGKNDTNIIQIKDIELNQETKEVKVSGETVRLTPLEFKILELLMIHPNRVFSINEIYEKVWKEPSYNAENTVAVHIRKIREKIEIDPKNPRYVKVVWGVGYKIEK